MTARGTDNRASPLVIRRANASDAGGIALIHVDAWRATYRGLLPDGYLAQLSYEDRERDWSRWLGEERVVIFVAEEPNGVLVGFASGGPEQNGSLVYRGELYAIYLTKGWQRRGIGKRLTSAVASWLAEQGMTSMLVRVLTGNPAVGFYEALGAGFVASRVSDMGGVSVEELAYGWADTTALLDRAPQSKPC